MQEYCQKPSGSIPLSIYLAQFCIPPFTFQLLLSQGTSHLAEVGLKLRACLQTYTWRVS